MYFINTQQTKLRKYFFMLPLYKHNDLLTTTIYYIRHASAYKISLQNH